nr:hypothetical protein [Tanacetum cinerariifolium]
MVNADIALDAGLDSEAGTYDNTSIEQHNGSSGSRHDANAKRTWADKVVSDKVNVAIEHSYDNNTLTKVHHSNTDTFENMFALEIQTHGQHEVENCTNVNHKAQQVNDSLTKQLEIYEVQETDFTIEIITESCLSKKIKLLNNVIFNLKSQACQKERSFYKDNEKYDELRRLHMLLPKEDNEGLGFEIPNEDENPFVLNKAKELTRTLYNIDEMVKDLLSDHKIISEEELKCEAEKRLKVKQRKSPLSYLGFIYSDTQFEEPPKVPLKRSHVNLKKHWNKLNW